MLVDFTPLLHQTGNTYKPQHIVPWWWCGDLCRWDPGWGQVAGGATYTQVHQNPGSAWSHFLESPWSLLAVRQALTWSTAAHLQVIKKYGRRQYSVEILWYWPRFHGGWGARFSTYSSRKTPRLLWYMLFCVLGRCPCRWGMEMLSLWLCQLFPT